MILNGDDGGFGPERTVLAFEEKVIGELQRLGDDKKNFLRRAELNHRLLQRSPEGIHRPHIAVVMGIAFALTAMLATGVIPIGGAAKANGNADRRRVRKKPGEPAYKVKLKSASGSGGLVGHN